MPSTSICLPLLGKYFLFILILVISSVVATCFILNIHFRSPSTHSMSPFIKRFFIQTLPRYLLINLPTKTAAQQTKSKANKNQKIILNLFKNINDIENSDTTKPFISPLQRIQSPTAEDYVYPTEVNRAIRNAMFIAYHLDNENSYQNVCLKTILFAFNLICFFNRIL